MDAITCCCPTCGQPLHSQLQWNEDARTFIAKGVAVRFSKAEADIFGAIWRMQGKAISLERLARIAWAERIDGGPETFNTISVRLAHIRRKMKSAGYTITSNMGSPRLGFQIIQLETT